MSRVSLPLLRATAKAGSWAVEQCWYAGGLSLLLAQTVSGAVTPPLRVQAFIHELWKIGVKSWFIVAVSSVFIGMVLAFQSAYQMQKIAAEIYIASLVALSVVREIGPVITALIVAGRVGSSIAAELGTMKVTEQIDAIKASGSDPVRYLVAPRFIAATLMMPLLTIIADLSAFIGGFIVAVYLVKVNSVDYINSAQQLLKLNDIYGGVFKSLIFGMIISTIACYKGMRTRNGAKGVGEATTSSVVISLISLFVANYFLSVLLFK